MSSNWDLEARIDRLACLAELREMQGRLDEAERLRDRVERLEYRLGRIEAEEEADAA